MSIDLENEYIQTLIQEYKKALKRYWAACGDTMKKIEESTDYNMVVSMMNDAICYQDQLMQAKLIYKKFNNGKKEAHQH